MLGHRPRFDKSRCRRFCALGLLLPLLLLGCGGSAVDAGCSMGCIALGWVLLAASSGDDEVLPLLVLAAVLT